MNGNGTFEINSQVADKITKTRTIVMEVNHTDKVVKDLGSLVKSFSGNNLTLDGAQLQGEILRTIAIEDLSGTTTLLSMTLELDGDLLIVLDADATIRITYLLK